VPAGVKVSPRFTDWIMLASEAREETSEALSCF
jgi:hypothetical protein